MTYLWAFVIGGTLCAIGQVLVDYTRLTPARILVSYVVAGVILGGLGWYQPLVELAGAGATVPLTGFGNLLSQGVKEAIAEKGWLGIFTGGLTASLMNRDRCFSVSYPLAECWRFAAFVSDFTIQTRDSRSRLPAQIPRSDAVFSSTRAALLPAALMGEDPALLSAVFCDRLHEPYRIPAIPDYPLLRELSLTLGAHAFFLSGSGPTCMAVYTEASFPEKASAAINALSEESRLRQKWRLLPLSVDREGLLRE